MARSLSGRAGLSLALWAGFWVLGGAMVLLLLAIPFAQAGYGDGPDAGGLLAGAGAVLLAWSLRPRWLLVGRDERPAPLAAEELPALHALVRRVAERVGVAPPQEVRLGPRLNASIAGERRWLRRRRILELGLPMFAVLEEAELASVVAHELAHERGGDVALGAWVHRTRVPLASALDALDGSAFWLDLPFRAYAWLFLRASASVSRAQERAADATAAAVAGPAVAWRALRKVEAHARAWDVYLDAVVSPVLELGARVPLLDGFAAFEAEARPAPAIAAALAAEEPPPSPHDTHPSMAERLRALDPARPPDAPAPPAGGCLALLGGAGAAEEAWYARMVSGTLAPMAWDEVAARAALPALRERYRGTALDPARLSLAAVPELVAQAGGLWRSLLQGVNLLSAGAQERAGRRALAEGLALALERRGFEPQLRPGAALRLRRGAVEVIPAEVVEALSTGALAPEAYRSRCAGWEPVGAAAG